MFKDRAFNLSVLFSSLWHLFWILAIGIVITPTVQPSNLYHDVSFLGPILEKTAFDMMTEGAKPQAETLYAWSTLFIDNAYLRPKGPGRKSLKGYASRYMRDKYGFIARKGIRGTKEIPQHYAEEIKVTHRQSSAKRPDYFIEGPAFLRDVIFGNAYGTERALWRCRRICG